jgi:hypothetical protein
MLLLTAIERSNSNLERSHIKLEQSNSNLEQSNSNHDQSNIELAPPNTNLARPNRNKAALLARHAERRTFGEATKLLSVSKATLQRWVKQGKLTPLEHMGVHGGMLLAVRVSRSTDDRQLA